MESNQPNRLPREFYLGETNQLARALLGKKLVHSTTEGLIAGIIVETEAYLWDDPASHSFVGQTQRNAVVFGQPGHAYVYISYGIHDMLNVVAAEDGIGEAILIRAALPTDGIEQMRIYRKQISSPVCRLAAGPGMLAQAFGVSRSQHNGVDLTSLHSPLWIEDGVIVEPGQVVEATRIGISKAKDKLFRYYILGSPAVSRIK